MAHYAKINQGLVEKVIVAEAEFFNTFVDSTPGEWIQTSYNTRGGQHLTGGTPYRANYPSEGYYWDSVNEIFYEPRPKDKDGDACASWVLNTTTGYYDPPITMPTPSQEEDDARKVWRWDESLYQSDNTKGWLLVDIG